jgi:hypothetical protein
VSRPRTPRDIADRSARIDGIVAAGLIILVVAIVAAALL